MYKTAVCVDRITVVGVLHNYSLAMIHDEFGLRLHDGAFYLDRVDDDDNTVNIAFMAEDVRRPEHWRLDFNPAHLYQQEKQILSDVIQKMNHAHFTRLDIAFDIFNNPLAMSHRVFRFNVGEKQIVTEYRGKGKSVETIYWGARKSQEQIRLYDKFVEQRQKKQPLPEGVKQWARLELQLRGKRPEEWQKSAEKMLSQFHLDNLQKLPVTERVMLHGLIDGTVEWRELGSKTTQAKYRSLIKASKGFDNSLAEELSIVFNKHVEDLRSELRGYLREFKVDYSEA